MTFRWTWLALVIAGVVAVGTWHVTSRAEACSFSAPEFELELESVSVAGVDRADRRAAYEGFEVRLSGWRDHVSLSVVRESDGLFTNGGRYDAR